MNDKNPSFTANHDDLEPQLESAVWAVLSEPLPADAIARVKSKALELEEKPRPNIRSSSRVPAWRRPWMQVASLAACILLVLSATLLLPSSSNAFAQVVSNIRKLATAKFTIENFGPSNLSAVASVKAPDRIRFDFQAPGQPVNITNGAAGELISFDSNSNEVSVNEIPKASSDFDILQVLQKPDVNAVLSKDKNTMTDTQLYDIFDGQGKIWIDIETQLPKRMEMTPPPGMGTRRVVYRDFEWDVQLDDSLFAMPVGKVVVRSSLLATPKEQELIGAFAIRQAFSQEPYEASFLDRSDSSESSTNPGLRLGRLAYDLSKNRSDNYQIQLAKLQGIWPVIGISQSEASDPRLVQKRIDLLCMKLDQWERDISRSGGWVGTGVQPGEAKPLCWWKDGGRIRVLRGDLTIVDADTPPANN
jgi:outer membrane lipoprotein-sorting protein